MQVSYSGIVCDMIVKALRSLTQDSLKDINLSDAIPALENLYTSPKIDRSKYEVTVSLRVDTPLRTVFFFVRICSKTSNHLELEMPFAIYSLDNDQSFIFLHCLEYHRISEALANPRGFMRELALATPHFQKEESED